MDIKEIYELMIEKNASDVFIRANDPLKARVYTEVKTIDDHVFSTEEINKLVSRMANDFEKGILEKNRCCEFASWLGDRWRFRVTIFYQRNTLVIIIRKIDLNLLTFEQLNLPGKILEKFCRERRGMILLTGITGSGKSTTIAAMIEYMNQNFGRHILTVEEPIEFTFHDKKALINQRELGKDVLSYEDALRQAIFHSPDVIYIGNIRDRYTCHAALTAAETGTLVFSTVHSVNAFSTVERIVNFFPPEQHQFVLNQLSTLLKGVMSQRLVPRNDTEGLIPAYEIMSLSPTISNLINKNQLINIPKCISTSNIFGMKSFNQRLWELVKEKKISFDTALDNSDDKTELELFLMKDGSE